MKILWSGLFAIFVCGIWWHHHRVRLRLVSIINIWPLWRILVGLSIRYSIWGRLIMTLFASINFMFSFFWIVIVVHWLSISIVVGTQNHWLSKIVIFRLTFNCYLGGLILIRVKIVNDFVVTMNLLISEGSILSFLLIAPLACTRTKTTKDNDRDYNGDYFSLVGTTAIPLLIGLAQISL